MGKVITFSATVTEKIHPKNELSFVRTQIKLQDIFTTSNSCFYFQFFPQVLRYEIMVFEEEKDIFLDRFFQLASYINPNDSTTLIITPKYFCLYQHNQLGILKYLTTINKEDIVSYITQTYELVPTTIVTLNQNQLEQIKEAEFRKTMKRNIHKVIPDNSFLYYLYFIGVAFVISLYLAYQMFLQNSLTHKETNTVKPQNNFELEIYKKHKNKNYTNRVKSFIAYCNSLYIVFETIEVHNNILKIQLKSTDKKSLFSIVNYSLEKVKIDSIRFEENEKNYIMKVSLYA